MHGPFFGPSLYDNSDWESKQTKSNNIYVMSPLNSPKCCLLPVAILTFEAEASKALVPTEVQSPVWTMWLGHRGAYGKSNEASHSIVKVEMQTLGKQHNGYLGGLGLLYSMYCIYLFLVIYNILFSLNTLSNKY